MSKEALEIELSAKDNNFDNVHTVHNGLVIESEKVLQALKSARFDSTF